MDPYFRPILLATGIVLILNVFLMIPVVGAPLLTYFGGGVLAMYFFKKEFKDIYREIKPSDALILGIGTGVLLGAALTLIIMIKLQDIDMQKTIIDTINESMKMRSQGEFKFIEELGPGFYIISAIVNLVICSLICSFGSFATLPFVNKGKK